MKKRHKLMVTLSAAAACVVLLAGLALAAGQLIKPRPDVVVAAKGGATSEPSDTKGDLPPEATAAPEVTSELTTTPEVTPELTETPEVTPEPTPLPEAMPELTATPEVTPEPTPTPEATDALKIVYTQPASNYYHSVPDCSGMVGAIEWTEASAISVGKQPCPVCIGGEVEPFATNTHAPEEETVEAPVYYTEGGVYYHGNDQCSGMQNAEQHTLAEAESDGKQRCPVCQPGEPDHYDLFLAAFGQGLDALCPGYAYAYSGSRGFLEGGLWYVTDGEAYMSACRVTSFLEADGGDPSVDSALGTQLADVLCFSFNSRTLENLWPFLSATEAGETALREKDEAVEQALAGSGLVAPVSLEEQNVWAAVDAQGHIVELVVYYTDADGACSVIVGWTLDDGDYVLSLSVEPGDHALSAAEYENRVSNDAGNAASERMTAQEAFDKLCEADPTAGKAGQIWLYLSGEANAAWAFCAYAEDSHGAMWKGSAWFIGEKECVCLGRSESVESWFFFTQHPGPDPKSDEANALEPQSGSYVAYGRELFSSRICKGKTTEAHFWMVGEDGLPVELDTGNGLSSAEVYSGVLTGKRNTADNDWVFLYAHDQLYQVTAQPVSIEEAAAQPNVQNIFIDLQNSGYTVTDCLYRNMDQSGSGSAAITVNLERGGEAFHTYLFRRSYDDQFVVLWGGWDDINIYPGKGTFNPDAGLPTMASGTLGVEASLR